MFSHFKPTLSKKGRGFSLSGALAGVLFAPMVWAFDPFTVAAVTGAGANALSAVSEAAGEIAASADAFGELYGEIDSDASVSQEGEKLSREIHEIEGLAYEAGYTRDEIARLAGDSADPRKATEFSALLKKMTRAVRAGKRAARLAMRWEKKAQLANWETAQLEREQLMALYRQIEGENQRDLNQLREKLREERDRRNQIAILKGEEKKAGAQVFGKTGVLSFPKQASVVEEAIKMAMTMRPSLFSLMLFVFLARALAYQFSFADPARFGDLIRDAVVCGVLLLVFPEIIRACVAICQDLATSIGTNHLQELEPGKLDFPSEISLMVKTRILVEWLFQWIKYLAFVTAQFLGNFGLGFLILLFPIVIFCSQMLNFSIAWPIFLGGFICICLWPLFWNATGSLAVLLWKKQDASLSDQLATILFSLLQFLSPLIGIACLKGQSLSKSIASASGTVGGAVTGGGSLLMDQLRGFRSGVMGEATTQGPRGKRGGGGIGRILSYPVNQGLGRVMAMGTQAARARQEQFARTEEPGQLLASAPSWKPVAKAAWKGLVLNQAHSPIGPSSTGRTLVQAARGMNWQPLRTSLGERGGRNVPKN